MKRKLSTPMNLHHYLHAILLVARKTSLDRITLGFPADAAQPSPGKIEGAKLRESIRQLAPPTFIGK